MLAPI